MTVGEKIRKRRIELELTQEEVAKMCGYKSRTSINKIELSRDLPLKKVKLLADVLDLSVSYLMGWDDEEMNEVSNVQKEVSTYSDSVEQKLLEIAKSNLTLSELDRVIEYANLLKKARDK